MERRVDRRLISRKGVVNAGMEDGIDVVRAADAMVDVEVEAVIRLERRDAASVDHGSVRGMLKAAVTDRFVDKRWARDRSQPR